MMYWLTVLIRNWINLSFETGEYVTFSMYVNDNCAAKHHKLGYEKECK